jgi:hypothetical protein
MVYPKSQRGKPRVFLEQRIAHLGNAPRSPTARNETIPFQDSWILKEGETARMKRLANRRKKEGLVQIPRGETQKNTHRIRHKSPTHPLQKACKTHIIPIPTPHLQLLSLLLPLLLLAVTTLRRKREAEFLKCIADSWDHLVRDDFSGRVCDGVEDVGELEGGEKEPVRLGEVLPGFAGDEFLCCAVS